MTFPVSAVGVAMLLRKIGNSLIPAIGFGSGGLGVAGYGSLKPFEDRLKVLFIRISIAFII